MVSRPSVSARSPNNGHSPGAGGFGFGWPSPWNTEVSNSTALLAYKSWLGTEGDSTTATPVFLTYSFQSQMTAADRSAFKGRSSQWKAFSKTDRADAKAALKKWGAASGITFLETKGDHGDIQFSWTPQKTTSGFAYYPDAVTVYDDYSEVSHFSDLSGNVYLNTHDRDRMMKDRAFKKYVLLHEIGHSLGLKHPFDETFFNWRTLKKKYDDVKYTVMAYKTDLEISPTTLKQFDIQAIRKLYGSNNSDGKQVAAWAWNKTTETLTLIGQDYSDKLWGTNVSDQLHGRSGDDRLNGLAGDDLLIGGSGSDTLTGGAGRDVFRFDIDPRKETTYDRILDFDPSRDVIELAGAVFTGLGPAGALNPAKFRIGELPEDDLEVRIIFEDDGTLSYDPDGRGPLQSFTIALITTTNEQAIHAGHFLVI